MKLLDIIKEYEKGDLERISNKSMSNVSKDPITSNRSVKKAEPIGTDSKVVDAAAKAIGSGSQVIGKDPKKMSDFVMQMRSQIPNLDDLIQRNPRFTQKVRSISNDAAEKLIKISKDGNGRK